MAIHLEALDLDLVGPFRGPCGICGGPDARHRTADVIVERIAVEQLVWDARPATMEGNGRPGAVVGARADEDDPLCPAALVLPESHRCTTHDGQPLPDGGMCWRRARAESLRSAG